MSEEIVKRQKRNLALDTILATGTYGVIYKCSEDGEGKCKEVVVKKPNPGRMIPSLDMIKHEIKIFEKLSEPGSRAIVKYFGCNHPGEPTYILMEWVSCGSLLQMMNQLTAPIDRKQFAKYAVLIIEGLAYMHRKLIVHGDLKAGNILLDGNDNLKLCDFGLSLVVKCRVRDGQEELDRCRYFGSPPFFPSPELRNGGFPTRCADIWSAGCVLYQMLTLLSESRVLAKCREQRFDFNMSASTATTETIDLLDLMLQVNPQNRSKTGDAVKASDQFLRFLHE